MASLADSLLSSSGRKLSLRVRPDLLATRHRYQGKHYWIVKDPVGLQYFRFQEEEFFLLQSLNGEASLDEIRAAFEEEFPPQKLRLEELGQFLGTLHRGGLIISDVPGQGAQLLKRRSERQRQEWIGRVTNILSMRFRGINPDRILNWLEPKIRWFFSPWAVAGCFILALSALTLITVQFSEFQSRLPSFHQFFTISNAFWLMIVLGITKVIHEFGHGLSCKHYGGECHEMGVMLLVLTPALYCNVSDSWMLPNKWHRAIIGAAGMYIEIVIASIATFIWWFSQPGLINHLALSTMFICSMSTVLFNGNPLLRYDGYYILSDLMEVPNLGQKASSLLSRWAGDWFLGIEPTDDPFLPRHNQGLFVVYAIAAACYRWVVVFSILFFLNEFFKPYRLEVIGRMIGMVSLYGLLVHPVVKVVKFFWVPGRLELVKREHLYWSLAGVAALFAALFMLPLPYRIFAAVELEPHDAASIYTEVPGDLEQVLVRPGDQVAAGAALARLSNIDLLLSIEQLTGRRDQYQAQLASLNARRFSDDTAGLQMPEVRKSVEAIEEQLQQKRHDLARLELKALAAGTVLPPPDVPKRPVAEGELTPWAGSPFEPRNLGCHMTEQDLFCQIGDPRRLHGLIVVEQSELVFLAEGQTVDVKLDALPGQTLRGQILEISKSDVKISPRHLSNKAGGELATKTDPSGVERPLETSYHVLVFPLDDPDGLLKIGLRGRAKIYAHWQPLGHRLWRWFSQTFHFKL